MKYTVVSCKPRNDKNTGEQYVDKYGNKGWYVMLNDDEEAPWSASLLAKNPLTNGQEVEGELEAKEYGGNTYYTFKKAKPDFSGNGGGLSKPSVDFRKPIEIVRQEAFKTVVDMYAGIRPEQATLIDILNDTELAVSYIQTGEVPNKKGINI